MSSHPAVSVVIPTFNRGDVLDRAISSVLNQSFTNFEIIVIDDCSTDNTVDIVRGYSDNRIRLIQHETNRGGSAARNTGIDNSRGDLIAFLDSDDAWKPSKLEKQVSAIPSKGGRYKISYTGYEVAHDERNVIVRRPSQSGNLNKKLLARDYIGPTSTVVVHKDCFESVGYFNESLPARQDYDMWLRLSQEWQFVPISESLVIKHMDREDRITKSYESRIKSHKQIIESHVLDQLDNYSRMYRRYALGKQYFSLGRYCQKFGVRKDAFEFFKASLAYNPLFLKCWLALIALGLDLDTETRSLLQLRSKFG